MEDPQPINEDILYFSDFTGYIYEMTEEQWENTPHYIASDCVKLVALHAGAQYDLFVKPDSQMLQRILLAFENARRTLYAAKECLGLTK